MITTAEKRRDEVHITVTMEPSMDSSEEVQFCQLFMDLLSYGGVISITCKEKHITMLLPPDHGIELDPGKPN